MKTVCKLLLLLLLLGGAARAQTYAVSPIISSQILGTNGQPLNGGFVYTCAAGSTCPGTAQPTYTSSSGSTQLSNPIILGVSGYAQCGSPGAPCVPFLNTSLFYKFVIEDSTGAVLYTFDGISAATGGGTPTTNYWTASGSTITNNNNAGTGTVTTASDLLVGGNAQVTNSLRLLSPGSSFYASITAANGMGSTVQWRWPAADSTGVGCLASDGMGNLSFTTCGGGGGGGAAGPLYALQSSNPAGTLYGDGNFVYTPATTPPTVTLAGNFVTNTSTGGFNASVCTASNCVQAQHGGAEFNEYVFVEQAAPGTAASGFAGLYADSTLHQIMASMNGPSASPTWRPVGLTGAWSSLTNGDCVNITVSSGIPYLTDAGGACTTGGGGGTVNAAGQYAIPYYSASGTGTVLSGSANLLFNPTSSPPQISLAGIMEVTSSTGGFNSQGTAYNTIQAPNGGVAAKLFTLTQQAAPSLSGSGLATMYADNNASPTLHYSINGGAYLGIASTTGTLTSGHCVSINAFGNFIDSGAGCGGSGGPIGSDTQVPYNKAGTESADANFTWLYTPQKLYITGISATEALHVANGYTTSDGGFATSSSSTTAIQAPNGQVTSKTMYVSDAYLWGTEASSATCAAGQARIFANSSLNVLQYCINGGGYQTIATGGLSSLNGLTGAPSIVGTANEINVSAGGSSITLSTPQQIATTSSPTFAGLSLSGALVSTVAGASIGLNLNSNFQVNGNGAATMQGVLTSVGGVNVQNTALNSIQTSGNINACNSGSCASSSAYSVAGSTVINSSGQFIGPNVLATGNVQTGGVYAVAGGFFGQTHTVTIGSCQIFFEGGIAYAFSGC